MTRFIRLDDYVSVCAQLYPQDLPAVAAAGYSTLVCNRPDSESNDQPDTATMALKAKQLALEFHNIPVGGLSLSDDYVVRMADVMRRSNGPILAYCRSGLRSSLIWALAAVRNGADPTIVVRQVEAVGFPTRVIRSSLGN